MDPLLKELKAALDARLYFLALVTALTLPDLCSALESGNAETNRHRYKEWCTRWFLPGYHHLSANYLWHLRNGVIHQGRLVKPGSDFVRVVFTLPDGRGNVFHQNVINDALNLDLITFCSDMARAVEKWELAQRDNTIVQSNLDHLVSYRANGIPPYIVGVPVIS